jgi:hypothetical protein
LVMLKAGMLENTEGTGVAGCTWQGKSDIMGNVVIHLNT